MKTNVIKFEPNRYKEDIDYILLEKAYTEQFIKFLQEIFVFNVFVLSIYPQNNLTST